jgi:hypothetical protein
MRGVRQGRPVTGHARSFHPLHIELRGYPPLLSGVKTPPAHQRTAPPGVSRVTANEPR